MPATLAGIIRSVGKKQLSSVDVDVDADADLKPTQTPTGHGELILVVDDEPNLCSSLERTLRYHGYQVLTAQDGAGAVSLFSKHQNKIRLVLTDLLMPVMDGVSLTRTLRNMNPNVPVILSSGMDKSTRKSELAELGISAILNKPYKSETLLAAVHKAIHTIEEVRGP